MKRNGPVLTLFALAFVFAMTPLGASAQGQIGTATVSGPVEIDGQMATGSVTVGNAARIASGQGATVQLALAGGGEVRMAGQADVIVTMGAAGPQVQVVCGEVTVTSTSPTKVILSSGGRVASTSGKVMTMSGGVSKEVKTGKSRDFGQEVTTTVSGAGVTAVVSSSARCHCDCP